MQQTTHPTNFAKLREMIAEMSVMELKKFSATIENDIKTNIEISSRKADVQEWAAKIKLIAEELKSRKILTLEFEAA